MLPVGQPKTRDFLAALAFPFGSSVIHMVVSGSFILILKIFLYLEREMERPSLACFS